MLSLLEHMYHEIGLVDEFNINPITLKRWLVCINTVINLSIYLHFAQFLLNMHVYLF